MIKVKDDIYWVGAVDWSLRNFHGYITHRGTTYNAYLVVDEKVALVDTVKEPFFPEMMKRVKEVIDPEKIDYLVSNHTEPDHSGSVKKFLEVASNAELIASEKGKFGLRKYFGGDLSCTTITEKPSVSLGTRTLQFVATPMLHCCCRTTPSASTWRLPSGSTTRSTPPSSCRRPPSTTLTS